jgi:ABC-type iron transport system FetAB ATPase subunit
MTAGLISIPGMMTGQILGGSTVLDAARYQILIIYWIAACSFGTIFSQLFFVLRICFDHHMVLRTNRLKKRDVKPNAIDMVKRLFRIIANTFSGKSGWSQRRRISSCSLPPFSYESTGLLPKGKLSVLTSPSDDSLHDQVSFLVSNLCYSFENSYVDVNNKDSMQILNELDSPGPVRRTLFQDLSFTLTSGGSAIIQGPSGTGKSTLLRILAGLVSHQDGTIDLIGHNKNLDMAEWRRKILYVPQTKVDIPGTPLDLVKKISSFSVRRHFLSDVPTDRELKDAMVHLVSSWGLNTSLLDADWKTLSGGESQKILLAIALASRPKVILLDESTSAMDPWSKIQIERSVQEQCAKFGMCAIWVTHDEEQTERIHKVEQKKIQHMAKDV